MDWTNYKFQVLRLILSILLFFTSGFLVAEVVEYTDTTQVCLLSDKIELLEEGSKAMSLAEVMASSGWKESSEPVPNLGINNSCWARLQLKNNTNQNHLLLVLPYNLTDHVEFYSFKGSVPEKGLIYGDTYSFNSRKYKHQYFIYDLNIAKGATGLYYLRLKSDEQLLAPMYVATPVVVANTLMKEDLLGGIFIGILVIMIVYNFFIYLNIKDHNYFFYILYVFFIGTTQLILLGYTFRFVFCDYPIVANRILIITPSLGGFTLGWFFYKFLQTPKKFPWWGKIYVIIVLLYLTAITVALMGREDIGYRLIDISALFFSLCTIVMLGYMIVHGERLAKYLLSGYLVLLIGFISFSLRNIGLLPYNSFTNYTMQAGVVLEAVIFSFALADRINVLKKENEEKQNLIIRQLKENEKYLLAMKESELLVERLKKGTLASQFESLKNQVNPHFLFNSLNVLSELIHQNQTKAVRFVEELSDVYRYVLESRNREVVAIASEVKFIEAFSYLLRIRFSDSLIIKLDVATHHNGYLPPLSIQLLVENAIKHNVISEKDPLLIEIFVEGEYVIVQNNLQKKAEPQKPSGIGIKNLKMRYEFLTDRVIVIESNGTLFTVKLPILQWAEKE